MDISALANMKLAGPAKKWSLSSLTETITCKEVLVSVTTYFLSTCVFFYNFYLFCLLTILQLEKPSKIRMGNWEADILSKEQLQYAATDAFASWFLYEV